MSDPAAQKTVHELKTWLPEWLAVLRGEKTFEVRKDDRDFAVGDLLRLVAVDAAPPHERVLGVLPIERRVAFILEGGRFGVEEGNVVMALAAEGALCSHRLCRRLGSCQYPDVCGTPVDPEEG